MAEIIDRVSLKRKRHAYDASFKLCVGQFAVDCNNNSKAAYECVNYHQNN